MQAYDYEVCFSTSIFCASPDSKETDLCASKNSYKIKRGKDISVYLKSGICNTEKSWRLYTYRDTTPESRKCEVREAPQRCPLLDNGSLGTFPLQRIGLRKPNRCYEINTRFRSNGWA
jgi:hypothetical protein